ncbi:MAG: hypothetical protein WC582_01450 [Patescibacteria group bacterium]
MEKIPEVYEKLKSETPEAMEKFSGQLFKKEDISLEEFKFEKLFDKYGESFRAALEEILNLWDSKENRKTLGHDKTHISYDLFEYLDLSEELKNSEKYMVLFGSLLHDFGRYPELLLKERSGAMDFDKAKQIQLHAALSGYLAALFARRFKVEGEDDPDIIQASEAFNRRVIGSVLLHGGKNEERDPVAHHIQSIDRLAGILGTREFVRNIINDGVQRGAPVYPDERLSYDETFPLFNNLPAKEFGSADDPQKSWTNILHYLEMPMRNMFPLSTERGMKRSKEMKRESGIILTLLSGGKNSELFRQIFAPELNERKAYKFPKTRLPEDIWEQINKGLSEEEISAMEQYDNLDINALVDKMLEQQAPDISSDDKTKVRNLLLDVSPEHIKDVFEAVKYTVARRDLNKKEEREFLLKKKESEDPLVSEIANKLLSSELFN